MKIVKRILMTITILIMMLPSIVNSAGLTPEQEDIIADFAKRYVEEGMDKKIVWYCYDGLRGSGYNNKPTSSKSCSRAWSNYKSHGGKASAVLFSDCSSFCSLVYHVTCGFDMGGEERGPWTTYTFNSSTSSKYFKQLSYNKNSLRKGDVVWKTGHVGIYVGDGKTAEFNGHSRGASICSLYSSWTRIYRVKDNVPNVSANFTWPDGTEIGLGSAGGGEEEEFQYNGIAEENGYAGSTTDASFASKFLNGVAGLIDYFIGLMTYAVRAEAVGFTNIVEQQVSKVINTVTAGASLKTQNEENSENQSGYALSAGQSKSDETKITIEDIVYNRVRLLDVNIFKDFSNSLQVSNNNQGAGNNNNSIDIVEILREKIALWYYAFRQFAIVCLLATLIYIGIRMAISSVAEERAKYKSMLMSWIAGFFILFFIHYFMVIVLGINDTFIGIFERANSLRVQGTGQEMTLYETIRTKAYELKFTAGTTGMIFYIILVILLIKYLIIYLRRLFAVDILILLAPLMAIGYAIDKIKDNKSQTMSVWVRDFTFNVLLQTIHALLYTTLVYIALDIALEHFSGLIVSMIIINYIPKAEKLFMGVFSFSGGKGSKSIEGITKDTKAKDFTVAIKSSGLVIASAGIYSSAAKLIGRGTKGVTNLAVKASESEMMDNILTDKEKQRYDKFANKVNDKLYNRNNSLRDKLAEKTGRAITKVNPNSSLGQTLMNSENIERQPLGYLSTFADKDKGFTKLSEMKQRIAQNNRKAIGKTIGNTLGIAGNSASAIVKGTLAVPFSAINPGIAAGLTYSAVKSINKAKKNIRGTFKYDEKTGIYTGKKGYIEEANKTNKQINLISRASEKEAEVASLYEELVKKEPSKLKKKMLDKTVDDSMKMVTSSQVRSAVASYLNGMGAERLSKGNINNMVVEVKQMLENSGINMQFNDSTIDLIQNELNEAIVDSDRQTLSREEVVKIMDKKLNEKDAAVKTRVPKEFEEISNKARELAEIDKEMKEELGFGFMSNNRIELKNLSDNFEGDI